MQVLSSLIFKMVKLHIIYIMEALPVTAIFPSEEWLKRLEEKINSDEKYADIASVSIDHAKERYNEAAGRFFRFVARFHTLDCYEVWRVMKGRSTFTISHDLF